MSPLDAVNHALTTMATGGFSTNNQSVMGYGNVWIEMIVLLFIAVFGDKGAADLSMLRQEKRLLMQKNDRIEADNLELLRQIDRLKNEDLGFIESIARRELGMVRQDEVILKLPEKKQ